MTQVVILYDVCCHIERLRQGGNPRYPFPSVRIVRTSKIYTFSLNLKLITMSMGVDKKPRSPPKPKAISELPYATLKRLADRLDMPCDGSLYWRKLISVMSGTPYDQLTVERFAMNAHRLDGSPAYALLTDMSNRGVSYDELITYLKKMNHYAALHELGYRGEGGMGWRGGMHSIT